MEFSDGAELIVGALAAGGVGAVTELAQAGAREALVRLRSRVATLLAGDGPAQEALQADLRDAGPARQRLVERLRATGAADDPELLAAARQILAATEANVDARHSTGVIIGGVGHTQHITVH